MSFEMDSWLKVCRCCLSTDATVSILDSAVNKAKFLEATAIEITADDKLPQQLCTKCFVILNTAHDFRIQCQKMDKELRAQLDQIMSKVKSENVSSSNDNISEEIPEEYVKKLQSIIKSEPMDDDDDSYYIVVIDNKDDSNNYSSLSPNIKTEVMDVDENNGDDNNTADVINSEQNVIEMSSQIELEKTLNSFLLSNNKVPTSVPATILQNEDHENEIVLNNNTEDFKDIDESSNVRSKKLIIPDEIKEFNPKNLIKIVTPYGVEKTILLENDDTNLNNENQEEASYDNDDAGTEQEIILCEGDDTSQFQILKVDGSEFVIEYADEGQITTVLQQEDGSFLCDCGEQFDDIQLFQKHQSKHNPAGEHLCNLCGKGFESAEILTGHTLLHRFSGPLVVCPFCSQLIRRSALTQHIKYTHNSRPQCSVCNKTFANQNNLKRHMMIHSGIKEFECDICFKRFHQKITMQTHRLTHINSTTCYLCDTIFEDKESLANHKESNECPKSKIDKNVKDELIKSVRQTVTTNLGKVLGFACSLCKKMFSLESALDHHIETSHIVDEFAAQNVDKQMKRFECSMCGKRCASQAMLLMHERVHTNERPFPCQLCTLRFKTKTHLRTHQLTHTREKKFGCSVCMKFFALKGNLVVHLRTHTGERPYVCSICSDAFIDSKYLKKHKLRKHAIENVPWNEY